MNRKAFYDYLRKRESGVFGTRLTDEQVRGMEGILDAFEWHGDGRQKTLAYALATAYHETGRQMVPVRETFAKNDATARRRLAHRAYAKPTGPYGHSYYGRGHVQLTWYANYKRTGEEIGVDLVQYPDKALDPVISARVLIEGLIDGRWNSKGKGIEHYLPTNGADDLRNARRTVNITDRWQQIGDYYLAFMRALDAADFGHQAFMEKQIDEIIAPPPTVDLPEPEPVTPAKPSAMGVLALLFHLFTRLFGRKEN